MTASADRPASLVPVSSGLDFRTVDVRGRQLTLGELRAAVPRAQHGTVADAEGKVQEIIADVRGRGLAALSDLASKFDGVEQTHPRVPAEALQAALDGLDPEVRAALE